MIATSLSAILIFQNNTTVDFISNHGQTSGAILLNSKSRLKFSDSQINFLSNFGGSGGAISLHSQSVLTVNGTVSHTQLRFLRNRAQKGGAIFVDDNTYIFGGQLLISAFETGRIFSTPVF